MTTYRLDRMFAPRSVAVVGASPREHSVGRKILRNLKAADFAGPIHLVNPNSAEIEGVKATRTAADLPECDLLVITSPPARGYHCRSRRQRWRSRRLKIEARASESG